MCLTFVQAARILNRADQTDFVRPFPTHARVTTLQMLAVRTNTALGRLSSLQRRAAKIPSSEGGVLRSALKELSDAVELLQVANDQLEMQLQELSRAKTSAVAADRRFSEMFLVLPCACVWTSMSGDITEANQAAAALLNVSRQHLAGRPFVLFLADRASVQDALIGFSSGATWSVDFDGEVRPRGRRPRAVQVLGRRFDGGDDQLCWFLVERPAVQNAAGSGG